jgi:hypothetical protein
MRFAHGLRNGVAIAPAEQASNPALTKTNKKGPARGPEQQLCVWTAWAPDQVRGNIFLIRCAQ